MLNNILCAAFFNNTSLSKLLLTTLFIASVILPIKIFFISIIADYGPKPSAKQITSHIIITIPFLISTLLWLNFFAALANNTPLYWSTLVMLSLTSTYILHGAHGETRSPKTFISFFAYQIFSIIVYGFTPLFILKISSPIFLYTVASFWFFCALIGVLLRLTTYLYPELPRLVSRFFGTDALIFYWWVTNPTSVLT